MLFILLAFGLLASAITSNKIILYSMSPTLLVGIRMLLGGSILLLYNYFGSKQKLTWQLVVSNLLLLLLVTISTTYLPSILKAYSLKNMVSSKAAFFGTLDPFVTAIFAYFFFGEKLTLKKILGILLAFLGALIMLISASNIEFKAFLFFSYPELSMLLSIVISRFGWILIQKLLKSETYTPAQINIITMLISGVLSLTTIFIYSDITIKSLSDAPFGILNYFPFIYLNSSSLLLFFLSYTIIIGNVIAYNLYAYALKMYSAVYVSLVGFSVPLFVHLYGWLLLSEKLSLVFFISCFITFIGFLIFSLDEKRIAKEKSVIVEKNMITK